MIVVLYCYLGRLPAKLAGSDIFLIEFFLRNLSCRNKNYFNGVITGAFRIIKYKCGWKMKQYRTGTTYTVRKIPAVT